MLSIFVDRKKCHTYMSQKGIRRAAGIGNKVFGGTEVWNCKAELIPDGKRYNDKNNTKLYAVVLQHAGKKNILFMQRQCTTSCPRTQIL